MRIAALVQLVAVAAILLTYCGVIDGAPVGSKTYIIHMQKNATHLDAMAKHAWYSELMEDARAFLAEDHPDDGMDTLHHVYHHVFDGFSARLTAEQVEYMQSLPCVKALYPDRMHKLHTTNTRQFVGLEGKGARLWPESNYGAGSIVGVIDTGIWPERLSFSDRGLGPVPKKWKGSCQAGTQFTAANCNKKIIGAKYFLKGYEAALGRRIVDGVDAEGELNYRSPRDSNGHGTHCASTAAGRWGWHAGYKGLAEGTALGMAPKARIAVYKALWQPEGRGMTSDLVAAFEHAVKDGVDVISYSIGSPTEPSGILEFFDGMMAEVVAAFNAVKKGVFVSAAGGNDGPTPGSIANVAPWYTTVAATTHDREVQQNVLLGNGETVVGRFGFVGSLGKTPLIYAGHAAINSKAAENASFCQAEALNPALIEGKLVLCNNDRTGRFSNSILASLGAKGYIFANTPYWGETLAVRERRYPSTNVGNKARLRLLAYIHASGTPTASILPAKTEDGVTPAPTVASFSSRGPIRYTRAQWLKPDIAAPGVDILAAGINNEHYAFMSGTSMACPHVSGFGALLHSKYPKWSPAAIRSAIMTTAITYDNTQRTITAKETSNAASPVDFGAGFAQPEKAMRPGLVYDMGSKDYLRFLCGLGYNSTQIELFDRSGYDCPSSPPARVEDANLPSFVAHFPDATDLLDVDTEISFHRTLSNVGRAGCTYRASVDVQPRGFHISIEPPTLKFPSTTSRKSFVLRVTPQGASTLPEIYLSAGVLISSGSVSWTDGTHVVRSPVVAMVGPVSGLIQT